ncbi:hypothetical protein BaRGS_00020938, partial [Batillaria attramentaria]
VNPFNMRLQNLNNFPSINTTYRSAYRSHSVALQRAKACSITSAAKSLDLLRQNIQKSINKELDQVVQKYIEKFFQPAASNIRLNNGANSVSEEHINAVCRQIFEEAKRMYTTEIRRSVTPVGEIPDNVSESGSINGTGRRVSPNPLKRSKVSDSDSEKGSDGGFPKKVVKRKGRPPLHASGRSTPLKPIKSGDQVRREGPKWDPERIKPDSLFVMGARANKALGLGNTRGRLYIRHPDVFKYSGDQDDKVWLHEQKLMPATGGKAYMLLVEDIVDLSKTEEYRDSPTLMMHECLGFQVPEWMIVKIKEQMRSMRSDAKRSRSHSPVAGRPEPPKTLPFSTFSDTASVNDLDSVGNKNSLQPSPADTEEMEFLSAADNDDTQPADSSPFGVTGGFDDAGLTGRVALVTGSTSGIGLGIAASLAKRGCDIILHGFGDADVIQHAKKTIEGHQVRSHVDQTDLCDPSSINKLATSISSIFPEGIDILVNNAGFQSVSGVTEFPLDVWQKMLAVHLTAPFLLIQQLLPNMAKKGWGRIINVSSIHGLVASPYKAAYVSAKHGVIGLTKVVALEAARTGVTCNAVCPGWVETPLFIKQAETRSKEQSISYEDARRQMVGNHPTEEPVKVEDVGELVAFVCSPAASQMTGSSLVVDGGWTAR